MAELNAVRNPMAQAITQSFTASAADLDGISVHLEFAAVDELSKAYAETQAGKLIRAITDTQRDVVRQVLGRALGGEITTYNAARAIRDTVGLHPAWAQAVVNLRERVHANALAEGKTLAAATALADRKAEQYSKRLIKRRAENIARTETITAENLGRYASWTDAVRSGVMNPKSWKEWNTEVGDGCDICVAMDGEKVPWDQPFSNGLLMPPAHPSCRCAASTLPPMKAPGEPGYDPELDDPDHLYGADYQARTGWTPLSQTRPTVANVPVKTEVPQVITGSPRKFTYDNTLDLDDDQLMDLIGENAEDPDAIDSILQIIDEREERKLSFGGGSFSPSTMPDKYDVVDYADKSPKTNPAARPERKLTRDEQVAEQFDAYVSMQYSRALEWTNGNFMKRSLEEEARRRGLTSESIFLAPAKVAKKFASEELLAFWEQHGRQTFTSYRYDMFRAPSDRKAAETVRRMGWQGKAPSSDRSTF